MNTVDKFNEGKSLSTKESLELCTLHWQCMLELRSSKLFAGINTLKRDALRAIGIEKHVKLNCFSCEASVDCDKCILRCIWDNGCLEIGSYYDLCEFDPSIENIKNCYEAIRGVYEKFQP